MADRPKSTPTPEGNAFRAAFLALIEKPELRAAAQQFGEALDDLAHEDNVVLKVDEAEGEYARRHLAAAVVDLLHLIRDLRSLSDFRDEIDDARVAVAAHDALPILKRVADKLDATFTDAD